jgi:predicted MPP superfamily phosphohydrolase
MLPAFSPRRHAGFHPAVAVVHRVPLAGLTSTVRVAHLTDLHFGTVTPTALLDDAVATTNALRPDLVVLTGDFVARGRRFLDAMRGTLQGLEAPAFGVLGNHDHWVGAAAVRAHLDRAGVAVLDNARCPAALPGGLQLLGVDDGTTGRAAPAAATAGLPPGAPVLALSHNPEVAPVLWAGGAGLVLAGHTHGGQLHVGEWTRPLWKKMLRIRFLAGWYAGPGGARLYVNPGVGSSVLPWRVGAPCQRTVALLELHPPEVPGPG